MSKKLRLPSFFRMIDFRIPGDVTGSLPTGSLDAKRKIMKENEGNLVLILYTHHYVEATSGGERFITVAVVDSEGRDSDSYRVRTYMRKETSDIELSYHDLEGMLIGSPNAGVDVEAYTHDD